MARPLKSLSELVLLKRGVSLASLPERVDTLADVHRFQNLLGGGVFCEELELHSPDSALDWLRDIRGLVDFRYVENFSPVRDETIPKLWPLFRCGDGHNFYFFEPARVFLAHYHDPDKLEVIGDDLVAALNGALDFNDYFIPEDLWPVFWKPCYSGDIRLSKQSGSIPTADEFLAECSFPQKPSSIYSRNGVTDLIWANLNTHLRVIYDEEDKRAFGLNVNLYCDGATAEAKSLVFAVMKVGQRFEMLGA